MNDGHVQSQIRVIVTAIHQKSTVGLHEVCANADFANRNNRLTGHHFAHNLTNPRRFKMSSERQKAYIDIVRLCFDLVLPARVGLLTSLSVEIHNRRKHRRTAVQTTVNEYDCIKRVIATWIVRASQNFKR